MIKRFLSVLLCVIMLFTISVIGSAAYDLTIDEAVEYYSILSGDDVETLQTAYTWSKNGSAVTAVLNADSSSKVDFWYDDNGVIQYDGFFGSSSESDSDSDSESDTDTGNSTGGITDLSSSVVSGSSSFLSLLGSLFNFCAENELCQMFLTTTFTSIGVGLLRRVTRAFGRGR